MVVSSEQWRDSAIHTHAPILSQIPISFSLTHNTEQSSMWYTIGLCWLSLLNIAVCSRLLIKWSSKCVAFLDSMRSWFIGSHEVVSIQHRSGKPVLFTWPLLCWWFLTHLPLAHMASPAPYLSFQGFTFEAAGFLPWTAAALYVHSLCDLHIHSQDYRLMEP